MTPEIYWLTLTLLLTALLWLPYISTILLDIGVMKALMEGQGTPAPKPEWAARLKRAHANAVENLVVFAPLAIIAGMGGFSGPATSMAAMIYFFARLAHAVVYALGLPVLRTVSFAVGVGCQVFLALTILGLT